MTSAGEIFRAALYVTIGVYIGASTIDVSGEFMVILLLMAFFVVMGLLSLVSFVAFSLYRFHRWIWDEKQQDD